MYVKPISDSWHSAMLFPPDSELTMIELNKNWKAILAFNYT